MNTKKISLISAAVLSAAISAASQAQTTTVIVDDNYVLNGTESTGVSFFGTTGGNAIETNSDSIGLISGTAGRTIHGLFPTQTLESIGDQIVVAATFLTPDTVGTTNEEFRMGLFDSLGRPGIATTTSVPEPLYNDIPGFYTTIDIEADGLDGTSATDLDMRRNEIETLDQTGTFLSTSNNFDTIGSSGSDANYAITANTSYTITYTVERIADNADIDTLDNLEITSELFQGETLLATITREDGGTELPIGTFEIDMFAAQAGSNAVGTSNQAGIDDNGIDFTAFSVSFFDADGVEETTPPVDTSSDETCYTIPTESGESAVVCL